MKDNNIETLNLDETIELIDLNNDIKNDEMLDFFDTPEKDENIDIEITKILDNSLLNKTVEINANKEKVDEYKPSIKDFNIKNAKTKKVVKKIMLYVIIMILIGFEYFITKTGNILTSIRLSANSAEPIKISENNKYGYIDNIGNTITNPMYIYAEDFQNGFAIVKNSSNLPLIIDKTGKTVVPTGKYFSLYRAGEDIIASTPTKTGLKYGILNANLKIKAKFIYDGITYIDGIYTYSKENTNGILNKDGKDIYNYKFTDNDEKLIDISISKSNTNEKYGVVKINDTSQIINLNTGKIILQATLNKIVPEDNNIFYEDAYGEKVYLYVKDDKVLYQSDAYLSMSIYNEKSGVLKALKKDYSYEYISTDTLKPLKDNLSENEVYFGNDVFVYKDYNTKNRVNNIVLVKEGKNTNIIQADFEVIKGFVNKALIIKYEDGKYSYINESGELITDKHFLEVKDFDEFGHAIAKTEDGYGVINLSGDVIIPFENTDIKMASFEVKKRLVANKNSVFFAVKKQNLYELYDKNGKKVNKEYYINVTFDELYPVLRMETELKDFLYMPLSNKEIKLTSSNEKYTSYENYIKLKNKYYNYKGKLIYTLKK